MKSLIENMEYDLRKQKRLGPAPIASFEKSFEDTASSTGTPELSRQDAVHHHATSSDSDKQNMDSETGGPNSAVTITSTRISTVTMSAEGSSPSRQRHHHEHSTTSETSRKRPPPLQSANILVQIQSASSGSGEVLYSGVTNLGVNTPQTPRIDISRASSSSQHEDSRDSSPDNVFEQVGTGTLQESIGLGFREEGAMDLRSSTEELYFMDSEQKKEEQDKFQQARKSPVIFKFDEHQTFLQQHQRKDSASSEVAALLCISGRTSRISSVGSQGSAVSRLSAVSGISRSPSPHKMLLETSFCGPKPLENVVDGSIVSTVEPATADVLEQVLLSRKHDPTQAVFAEGIKIEGSPKKSLVNGNESQRKKVEPLTSHLKTTKPSTSGRPLGKKVAIPTVGLKKDAGKCVIGSLPSGAEYIRINLKPDYLYEDKGVAPNERIIEVTKGLGGASERKKPATLSLGRDINAIEQRLTPNSSPKPVRHQILARETGGSRSPSPATVTISRKSSFCSLFKPKDSPDSPRDQSRSRSKSRERPTPQSQSGTPSKQKSVLAIFKPRRSVSKSKCSSPIDHEAIVTPLDGISQVEFKFKSEANAAATENRSRPSSRLRYYDTPLDGKSIHIPLHTPPEEKQDRKFPPVSNESKEPEPPPPSASSSGSSHITTGPTQPTSATLPPVVLEAPPSHRNTEKPPALPQKAPKLAQIEKTQRIVNLDAIQSIPAEDNNECMRTWSMEVQRHSSQESQETNSVDSSNSTVTQRRISKPNLSDVVENSSLENGTPPKPKDEPDKTEPNNQHGSLSAKEKKRLMFTTKIGSGSQEQMFITQFSISKTESLSSQLSEQQSIPDSPNAESKHLHRTDTVIRRVDESQMVQGQQSAEAAPSSAAIVKRKPSTEEASKPTVVGVIEKKDSSDESKRKSKSTDDEDKKPLPPAVVMRKKDQSAESKRKSKSASEEDDSTNRHSRYIESFDVRKGIPDLKAQSRNSSDSSIKERDSRTSSREDQDSNTPLAAPKLPPKSLTTIAIRNDRQSVMSTTDDLAESSESERDSEMDPNRIKRHLPRHIGAIEDHESTGLVSQDSFEDELPYVPTTLPEERALGVALIPAKDRINMDMKTCPVDRPRSTTPMNPACLEEYCGFTVADDTEHIPIRGEKLRISLPRKDSLKDKSQRTKSPRRVSNASGKTWFEFAEQGIGRVTTTTVTTPTQSTTSIPQEEESPPPLPPRKPISSTGQWIDFDNIPEKRKAPKRITALPKDSSLDFTSKTPNSQPVQYNYVKPEECQCECHEVERESHKSIADVDLLPHGEDLQPLLDPDSHEGVEPSDSSVEYSYDQDERTFETESLMGNERQQPQHPDSPESRSTISRHTPTSSNCSRRRKSGDSQKP